MSQAPPRKPEDPSTGGAEDAAAGVAASGLLLATQFMGAFTKTIRSANLYNRNNALLGKFLQDSCTLFAALTQERGDVELGVRADRLLLGKDVVLQDADRESGLPFRLYREGVRRLTLLQGMPPEELRELIGILGGGNRTADEDLVTLLWKAALPHVKYITVDISSAAYSAGSAGATKDPEETDAEGGIREELNALLGAIYQGGRDASASVRGISIGADDLLALKTLGSERDLEMGTLGTVTYRPLFPVPPDVMAALAHEAEAETDQALTDRALDVLLAVLFSVRTGAETKKVVEQLLALFDSLLLGRDFRGSAGLVDRVRLYGGGDTGGADPSALKNLAITRQLVKMFTSEQRLTAVVAALNEMQNAGQADLARLLATLGQDDPSVLLGMLPGIQNPQHRRLLCDTVVGVGMPRVSQLAPHLQNGEWFVGRDILYLLSKSTDPEARSHILDACDAGHPRLRQTALSMLGPFEPGPADDKILTALTDKDAGVRQTAVKLAAQRRLAVASDMMRDVVLQADFGDRELGEIRTYLMALALLGGEEAIDALDHILNPPIMQKGMALLDRLKNSVDAAADSQKVDLRIAAAAALGSIDHPLALAALQKGARSVIPAVKNASLKALLKGNEPPPGSRA